MKNLFLRVGVALLVFAVLIVAYGQFTLMAAGGGLPVWDGDLSVEGIEDRITISRDDYGNPHIQASSEIDLYFAQGFVHAQDRFWQIALTRQVTQGRMSEWFGSRTVGSDRLQRMFGWQELADASYAAMSADDRRMLDAYAAGINAWLASDVYQRPPEMRVLHVHPEPWQPSHSFLIGGSLFMRLTTRGSETLNSNFNASGIPLELLEIFDAETHEAPPIVETRVGETVWQRSMPFKEKAFSNNWTLSGEHTSSGLPLMANDPQLDIALPNTWQLQAHHLGDGLRAGGTFPGIPGISIGHNSRLAWGITNSMVDAQDIAFLEKHPDDSSLYRRGPASEWESYIERDEIIQVRFGRDLTETVRRTDKGVVWPEGFPAFTIGSHTDRTIEIRNVFHDKPGNSVAAFLNLNRASTVEEGLDALRDMSSLAFNYSFADVEGSIGYTVTGSIAVRDETHATTVGFYPDDDNDWAYVDFDVNPRVINPASGRIVSANQQIIGDDYPYYLTDFWATASRAQRIHELLDETAKHSVESFRAMQSNSLSPVARQFMPLLLEVEPAEPADAALVAILEGWDYRFSLDANAAVIWATWVAELRRQVFSDELGSVEPPGYVGLYYPLAKALNGDRAEWCDNSTTDAVEDCQTLLATSLSAARTQLEQRLGADPASWRWGDVGRFRHRHAGFDALPILGDRFTRESAMKGGPESMFINSIDSNEAPVFSNSYGSSSFQGIYDLANLEDSLFMISGGTSGHFQSPHYYDMTTKWLGDERVKLGRVPDEPAYELNLEPALP